MSSINFSIQGSGINSTLYKGTSRHFNFLVDEPQELGGEDLAGNPVEYLLAGYSSCLNVVVHLVAKELDIRLNDVQVNINGDINPLKFLGLSQEGRAGFQSLQVDIDLSTDAPQDQIDLLFKSVKDRCPVNDNLSNITPIQYNLNVLSSKQEAYA